jgi:hypothetical protein
MSNLDQVHKMLEGGHSNVPLPQDTEKYASSLSDLVQANIYCSHQAKVLRSEKSFPDGSILSTSAPSGVEHARYLLATGRRDSILCVLLPAWDISTVSISNFSPESV